MTKFVKSKKKSFLHHCKSKGFYLRVKRGLLFLWIQAFYYCHFSNRFPKDLQSICYVSGVGKVARNVSFGWAKGYGTRILWEAGSAGFQISVQAFRISRHCKEFLLFQIFYLLLNQQEDGTLSLWTFDFRVRSIVFPVNWSSSVTALRCPQDNNRKGSGPDHYIRKLV